MCLLCYILHLESMVCVSSPVDMVPIHELFRMSDENKRHYCCGYEGSVLTPEDMNISLDPRECGFIGQQ
jgi:hypothetical protein